MGDDSLHSFSGLRAARPDFDPSDLYPGFAEGDDGDAADCAAASAASAASSGRGSEDHQAGGSAHPARKAGAAARLLAQPQPVYPPLARQARIQGNVVLHAIIDKDGRVGELQVISGHPLLVQSALDAVKNWRYQPTQLNGEPVEVDTTITVSFVLGG